MYSRSNRQGKQTRKAFSLVEIMVVIVIIGLLASVLTVSVKSYLAKANVSTARMKIAKVVNEMSMFKQETGTYPTVSTGLAALLQPNQDTGEANLTESDLIDPWKNELVYVSPGPDGQPFEIISLGADGKEGGEGEDQDISHLDLQ